MKRIMTDATKKSSSSTYDVASGKLCICQDRIAEIEAIRLEILNASTKQERDRLITVGHDLVRAWVKSDLLPARDNEDREGLKR
jgi:hypothetical protein